MNKISEKDRKIEVLVDMKRYCSVYGENDDVTRRENYSKNYEIMSLTPNEIKNLIEQCINIKIKI